ncbi:MAG: DNA polymerase III subunit delta' [Sphingomonadaceae bacterium]|nr:DNA polymerase III subunit delta' [Sphingomonadaceae bacterium]MCP5385058.1 DNA polymerase III subunit delta' [Altererythrobacter sp.]MCP5391959.1 DNA polymerase III subunit delta' [Sphingomonadaceae bacterium]MCP5394125.1 DNA polymerase III subunit delta' [Sphingomonadaceae bacterium]
MSLFGHDEAWGQWRNALAGPRMHHAWLLAGKRGLGKMHFARAAAQELVASVMPVGGADHPDIIVLDHAPKDEKEEKKRAEGKPYETKRNISVGQIRQMQQRLITRPTLGDRRAIIIDPADDMEPSASNALLKSLEEPPEGTFFLLVSHRPARLLPTIRSRCRLLRFHALGDDQVEQAVRREAQDADAATIQASVAAASGSPGVALEFVEQGLGRLYGLMEQLVREGDRDFAVRGQLAEAIGARPKREAMQAALDLARSILAARIGDADRPAQRAMIEAHGELVRLAGQAPTYNFDAGLLVMQIGSLLASAAPASERANV